MLSNGARRYFRVRTGLGLQAEGSLQRLSTLGGAAEHSSVRVGLWSLCPQVLLCPPPPPHTGAGDASHEVYCL